MYIEKERTKVKTKAELAKINSRKDNTVSFISDGLVEIDEMRNDHEVKITATADGEIWLLPNMNQSPISLSQNFPNLGGPNQGNSNPMEADTEIAWQLRNPILQQGAFGLEITNNLLKSR